MESKRTIRTLEMDHRRAIGRCLVMLKESTFRIGVIRGTLYSRGIGSKYIYFWRSRIVGS